MASPRQRVWFPESGHAGAAHSLPIDVVPSSYQPAMAGSTQYPPLDESTESCEEASISHAAAKQPFYGATPTSSPKGKRMRKPNRSKNPSTSTVSVTSLKEWFGSYEKLPSRRDSEEDSDEEEPPIIELIYRRSCKDKTKLILLLSLYFFCMVLAGIFAFYSIQGLVYSYQHRVRTVEYITVEKFPPIGIAVFPEDFAYFNSCEFKYNDDVRPDRGNWTDVLPAGVEKDCTHINITFHSSLIGTNRTAMVFRGPSHVRLKQSLALLFIIDTTVRVFSGMEYLLIEYWDDLVSLSYEKQQAALAYHEANTTLYTVPAGFRSWVKLFYITKYDAATGQNESDFLVQSDYSIYNDRRNISDRTTNVIYALFEWKDPFYEYADTIISTTVANTIGAMAGVFLTLQRAANFFWRWVQRIRREREKKLIKLQELQEEQKAVMEEYEKRKQERKLRKQNSAKKLDIKNQS